MTHLKVMKLMSAKKILEQFGQYDDYGVVELLEMEYEKLYREMPKY